MNNIEYINKGGKQGEEKKLQFLQTRLIKLGLNQKRLG